jgi:hypothetical protein
MAREGSLPRLDTSTRCDCRVAATRTGPLQPGSSLYLFSVRVDHRDRILQAERDVGSFSVRGERDGAGYCMAVQLDMFGAFHRFLKASRAECCRDRSRTFHGPILPISRSKCPCAIWRARSSATCAPEAASTNSTPRQLRIASRCLRESMATSTGRPLIKVCSRKQELVGG